MGLFVLFLLFWVIVFYVCCCLYICFVCDLALRLVVALIVVGLRLLSCYVYYYV